MPIPIKRLSLLAALAIFLFSAAPDTAAQLATADDVKPEDYRIYRSDGTPASWEDVAAAMKAAHVVFVGELHNDPVSHKVEQEVLQRWFATHGSAAALSLEMFSRDVQYIVDEYLASQITDAHFQQASSPWSNYVTDYRPLVEYARENGLSVIAANAPRRYANLVTRVGRDALMSLSDQARGYLAPLPYGGASERYTAQWNKVMSEAMAAMTPAKQPKEEAASHAMAEGHEHGEGEMDDAAMEHGKEHDMGEGHEHGEGEMDHAAMRAEHHGDMSDEEYAAMHKAHMEGGEGHEMGEDHEHGDMQHGEGHDMGEGHEKAEAAGSPVMPSAGSGHGGGSMLDAQSLWDATMAWSIAEHLTRRPGARVAHMVGGFHVETGTGIPEHMVQYRPGTRMLIISVQSVDDPAVFAPEEHTGLGDFVVLGDASLPRTYETRER
ncbi:MAG: ChaN family lipoprotein [Bacteroidetes bacterium]|nr:ChaN family lipoprotein [Bacteroidota bacterium]